jgi:outer membrane protein insertion porin family
MLEMFGYLKMILNVQMDNSNSISFYQQLALGTGAGLRLDFDFFVVRADLGIPLYKPYQEEGNRWVNEFPEDNFKDWRKKNFVWNIAIGYPF